ncbi:MAG: GNAT family N-acetyltransferase [Pyrinomonadaceae bacterium]|nr:GNAT family N-acetyltransferase [Pyrinomonadaceae bacterium]
MEYLADIRPLEEKDCRIISKAFEQQDWDKPQKQFQTYLAEQSAGKRSVLVAEIEENFAGYLTICWKSNYQPFRQANIPEIVDLNVLEKFQNRGIGSQLIKKAEELVAERAKTVGIAVGLFSDYGKAQRLYVKRGYIPDGLGISQDNRFIRRRETIRIDDDLALYFTKTLHQ